jgi:hypothetical protein
MIYPLQLNVVWNFLSMVQANNKILSCFNGVAIETT